MIIICAGGAMCACVKVGYITKGCKIDWPEGKMLRWSHHTGKTSKKKPNQGWGLPWQQGTQKGTKAN